MNNQNEQAKTKTKSDNQKIPDNKLDFKQKCYSFFKWTFIIIILTITVIVVTNTIVYFITEHDITKELFVDSGDTNGWLSFLGSAIAAIITLIILYITYNQNENHLKINLEQQNKTLSWQHDEVQLKHLQDLIIENNTVFCVHKYIQNITILDYTQIQDIRYKQLQIINNIEMIGVQKAKNDIYHLVSEDGSKECKEYFELAELIYYEYYVYLSSILLILDLLLKKEEDGNTMEQTITIMSDHINKNINTYEEFNNGINSSYIQNAINFMQKLNYSKQLSYNDITDIICDIAKINSKITSLTQKGFNLIKHKNNLLVAEIHKII